MSFLVDRTYQREIKPVPTLSCGGVFRYRSGERLHGMQEVTGSIPVFSTTKTCQRILAGLFLHIRLLAHPACKEPIRFVTRRVKHLAMLADALRVEPGVQPALVSACSL